MLSDVQWSVIFSFAKLKPGLKSIGNEFVGYFGDASFENSWWEGKWFAPALWRKGDGVWRDSSLQWFVTSQKISGEKFPISGRPFPPNAKSIDCQNRSVLQTINYSLHHLLDLKIKFTFFELWILIALYSRSIINSEKRLIYISYTTYMICT